MHKHTHSLVASLALALALGGAACGPTLHDPHTVPVVVQQYGYDPSYVVMPIAVQPYVRVEQPVATVVRFEVPSAWAYGWSSSSRVRVLCGGGAGVFTPTLEYGRRYVVALEGSYGAGDCRLALATTYDGSGNTVIYRGYEYTPPSSGYVLRPVRYRMDL